MSGGVGVVYHIQVTGRAKEALAAGEGISSSLEERERRWQLVRALLAQSCCC